MLTAGNVTRTMEKVTEDKRRRVWEKVLSKGAVEQIYSSHSSEEEKLRSCADIYVTCKPDSSWEKLVQRLYYEFGEMAAAKEAKGFLQQKGRCLILFFTLCACTRGKVISSVVVVVVVVVFPTKITKSQGLCMLMSGQSCEYIGNGKKMMGLCSTNRLIRITNGTNHAF